MAATEHGAMIQTLERALTSSGEVACPVCGTPLADGEGVWVSYPGRPVLRFRSAGCVEKFVGALDDHHAGSEPGDPPGDR